MRRSAAGGRRDGGGSAPAVQSAGAGARLLHLAPGVLRGRRGRRRAGPCGAERSGPAAGSEVWRRRRPRSGRAARWGGRERGVEPAPAPRSTARLRAPPPRLRGAGRGRGAGGRPQPKSDIRHPVLVPELRTTVDVRAVPGKEKGKQIKNENDWTQVFRAHSSSQWNRGGTLPPKTNKNPGCPTAALGVEHLTRLFSWWNVSWWSGRLCGACLELAALGWGRSECLPVGSARRWYGTAPPSACAWVWNHRRGRGSWTHSVWWSGVDSLVREREDLAGSTWTFFTLSWSFKLPDEGCSYGMTPFYQDCILLSGTRTFEAKSTYTLLRGVKWSETRDDLNSVIDLFPTILQYLSHYFVILRLLHISSITVVTWWSRWEFCEEQLWPKNLSDTIFISNFWDAQRTSASSCLCFP